MDAQTAYTSIEIATPPANQNRIKIIINGEPVWYVPEKKPMSEGEASNVMVEALSMFKLHQGKFCHKAARIAYRALLARGL